MTKPAKLIYDDARHAYYVDGRRWTGASSYGGRIEDQNSLIQWGKRQAAKGVAMDDQLRQTILLHLDDDAKLDKLAEQALTVAGANASRDRGSEIHRITELVDRGDTLPLLTDDMRQWIDRWRQVLADHDITIDKEHVERIVVVPEFKVCGTFDRLAWHKGRRVVLDLKTGKRSKYMHTMCVQLALLANAEWITRDGFTHGEKTTFTEFDPLPEVDTEVGLIVSMPSDGTEPVVYELPLLDGLRAARLAKEAREWTSSSIGVALTASTAAQPTTSPPTNAGAASPDATTSTSAGDEQTPGVQLMNEGIRRHIEWRLERIKKHPEATAYLRANWGFDQIPKWSEAGFEHYEAIGRLLNSTEAKFELPFDPPPQPPRPDIPEPAPRELPDEGAVYGKDEYTAMLKAVKASPQAAQDLFIAWRDAMTRAGKPLNLSERTTERRLQIARAMHAWALVGDEALLRAGLALVLGDDAVQAAFSTGALLGSLTIAEATGLGDLALALEAGQLREDVAADGAVRLVAA